jgi:hypothetical protein
MIRSDYVFAPAAQTITFTNPVSLTRIGIITNITSGIIIYNGADPTTIGTLAGKVLTLAYNTTAMSATDNLQIYYTGAIDNTILYSGTISAAGASAGIDTTGYTGIVAQIYGNWVGEIYFEATIDGNYWDTCFILSRDEVSLQDVIDQNGTYTIRHSGIYTRFNCQQITGTAIINIVGRTTAGISGADMLSFAMDKTNKMPLQVQLPFDLKQDSEGALINSDAVPLFNFISQNATSPLIIDTKGYNSVVIHESTAGIITPTSSNDGVNWLGVVGFLSTSPTVPIAATAGAGITVWPVMARYFKLTGPASSVAAQVYLRTAAFFAPGENMTTIGGTPVVTANVNGMLAVGGNVAPGSAPTAYPLLVAGVDSGALTRRLLTDALGRIQDNPSIIAQDQTTKNLSGISPTFQNGVATQEKNVDQIDGQSFIELLSQILYEIKITNQYLCELPLLQNTGTYSKETPDIYRADNTL